MLSYEQMKAIETALGPEKAAPVLEAFQTTDARVMTALLNEVATKADIANLRAEFKEDIGRLEGRLEGRMVRLETMLRLLIGLAALAVAFFSPVAEKLLSLL